MERELLRRLRAQGWSGKRQERKGRKCPEPHLADDLALQPRKDSPHWDAHHDTVSLAKAKMRSRLPANHRGSLRRGMHAQEAPVALDCSEFTTKPRCPETETEYRYGLQIQGVSSVWMTRERRW